MQPRSIEQRITLLEQQMLELKGVPSRIAALESRFEQLRVDLRDEVSAIRKEFKAADDETRVFMRVLHEDALTRIQATGEGRGANREDR